MSQADEKEVRLVLECCWACGDEFESERREHPAGASRGLRMCPSCLIVWRRLRTTEALTVLRLVGDPT